jgi:hypothetical protein
MVSGYPNFKLYLSLEPSSRKATSGIFIYPHIPLLQIFLEILRDFQ